MVERRRRDVPPRNVEPNQAALEGWRRSSSKWEAVLGFGTKQCEAALQKSSENKWAIDTSQHSCARLAANSDWGSQASCFLQKGWAVRLLGHILHQPPPSGAQLPSGAHAQPSALPCVPVLLPPATLGCCFCSGASLDSIQSAGDLWCAWIYCQSDISWEMLVVEQDIFLRSFFPPKSKFFPQCIENHLSSSEIKKF